MPVRDAWQQAFPFDEARRAATFLVETWKRVAPAQPRNFNPRVREDKLTELLATFVENWSVTEGHLTGQWSHEHRKAILGNDDGKIIKRIRKDITYFSNAAKVRLTLVFEFKKLRDSKDSFRAYEGGDGMRRFVDGYYAAAEPLAMMVGMVIGDRRSCVAALRRSLMQADVRDTLCMVSTSKGDYLRDPSGMFPHLADFDTEHNRPPKQAPTHGTTMLSHIFVILADEDVKRGR
ncbi:MAG: hypothetical protein HY941_01170 [Gammaproteobacteria bacterium]|nr:hypothetical protein [Gammaproteobacteria bacterium]